jgi:DNA-binding NarL/FixJ family response regulator
MSAPLRLLLVEDNEVFREALELLLGLHPEVQVVAAVTDGEDAVSACREHRPDVVVMDFRLPGLDGVQATRELRQVFPDVAVVCLSADVSAGTREALLAAGADSCLSKDTDVENLVTAVLRAASRAAA